MTNTEVAKANRERYVAHVQMLRNRGTVVPSKRRRKERTRGGATRAAVARSWKGE